MMSKTNYECESFGGTVLRLEEKKDRVDIESAIKEVTFNMELVLLTVVPMRIGVEYQVVQPGEILILKEDGGDILSSRGCTLLVPSNDGSTPEKVIEIFTPEEFATHMSDILRQLGLYIVNRNDHENIAGLLGCILPYEKIKDVKDGLIGVMTQPRMAETE